MKLIPITNEMKDGRIILLATRSSNMFAPWTGIPRKARWIDRIWRDAIAKEQLSEVCIMGAFLEQE